MVMSSHKIQITSIQGDLIQLEIGDTDAEFCEAVFAQELHENTQNMGIAYFSVGATTLEGVHAKLLQADSLGDDGRYDST